MKDLSILREARNRYAESPSHAPYRVSPKPGEYCVITACFCSPSIYGLVARAAGVVNRGDNEPLIRWNAENSTEDVLAAFDRAIEEMGS